MIPSFVLRSQAESHGKTADAIVFYGLSSDWESMALLLERELGDRLRVDADGRQSWKVWISKRLAVVTLTSTRASNVFAMCLLL